MPPPHEQAANPHPEQVSRHEQTPPVNPNFFTHLADDANYLLHAAEQELLPHTNPLFASAHNFVNHHIGNATLRHGANEFLSAVQEHVFKADFVVETGLALLTCTFGGSVAGALGVKSLLLRGLIVHLGSSRLHQGLESLYHGENRMHLIEVNKDVRGTMNMGAAEYVGHYAQPLLASFFGNSSFAARAVSYFAARSLGGLTMSLGAATEIAGARMLDRALGVHYFVDAQNNDIGSHFTVQALTKSFFSDLGMNIGGHVIGPALRRNLEEQPLAAQCNEVADQFRRLLKDDRGSVDLSALFGIDRQEVAHLIVENHLNGTSDASKLRGALFDPRIENSATNPDIAEEFRENYTTRAGSRKFYFSEDGGYISGVEIFRKNGSRLTHYGNIEEAATRRESSTDLEALFGLEPQRVGSLIIERVLSGQADVSTMRGALFDSQVETSLRSPDILEEFRENFNNTRYQSVFHFDAEGYVSAVDLIRKSNGSPYTRYGSVEVQLENKTNNAPGSEVVVAQEANARVDEKSSETNRDEPVNRDRDRELSKINVEFNLSEAIMADLTLRFESRTANFEGYGSERRRFIALAQFHAELVENGNIPLNTESKRPLSITELGIVISRDSTQSSLRNYSVLLLNIITCWNQIRLTPHTKLSVGSDRDIVFERHVLNLLNLKSPHTAFVVLRLLQEQTALFGLRLFEESATEASVVEEVADRVSDTLREEEVREEDSSGSSGEGKEEGQNGDQRGDQRGEAPVTDAATSSQIIKSRATDSIINDFKLTDDVVRELSDSYEERIKDVESNLERSLCLVRLRNELEAQNKLPLHPENLKPLTIVEFSYIASRTKSAEEVRRIIKSCSDVQARWNEVIQNCSALVPTPVFVRQVSAFLGIDNTTARPAYRLLRDNLADFGLSFSDTAAGVSEVATEAAQEVKPLEPPAAGAQSAARTPTIPPPAFNARVVAEEAPSVSPVNPDVVSFVEEVPAEVARPLEAEVSVDASVPSAPRRVPSFRGALLGVDPRAQNPKGQGEVAERMREALGQPPPRTIGGSDSARIADPVLAYDAESMVGGALQSRVFSRDVHGNREDSVAYSTRATTAEGLRSVERRDGTYVLDTRPGFQGRGQKANARLKGMILDIEAESWRDGIGNGFVGQIVERIEAQRNQVQSEGIAEAIREVGVEEVAAAVEIPSVEQSNAKAELQVPAQSEAAPSHTTEQAKAVGQLIRDSLAQDNPEFLAALPEAIDRSNRLIINETLSEKIQDPSLDKESRRVLRKLQANYGLFKLLTIQAEVILDLFDSLGQEESGLSLANIESALDAMLSESDRSGVRQLNFRQLDAEIPETMRRVREVVASLYSPNLSSRQHREEIYRNLAIILNHYSTHSNVTVTTRLLASFLNEVQQRGVTQASWLVDLSIAALNEDYISIEHRIRQDVATARPEMPEAPASEPAVLDELAENVAPVETVAAEARPVVVVAEEAPAPIIIQREVVQSLEVFDSAIESKFPGLLEYIVNPESRDRRNVPSREDLLAVQQILQTETTFFDADRAQVDTRLREIDSLLAGPSQAQIRSYLLEKLGTNDITLVSDQLVGLSEKALRGLYLLHESEMRFDRSLLNKFLSERYLDSRKASRTDFRSRRVQILEAIANLHDRGARNLGDYFQSTNRDQKLNSIGDNEGMSRFDSCLAELEAALLYSHRDITQIQFGERIKINYDSPVAQTKNAMNVLAVIAKHSGVTIEEIKRQTLASPDFILIPENSSNQRRILVEVKDIDASRVMDQEHRVSLLRQAYRYALACLTFQTSFSSFFSHAEYVFMKEPSQQLVDSIIRIFNELQAPVLIRHQGRRVEASNAYDRLSDAKPIEALTSPAYKGVLRQITPPIPTVRAEARFTPVPAAPQTAKSRVATIPPPFPQHLLERAEESAKPVVLTEEVPAFELVPLTTSETLDLAAQLLQQASKSLGVAEIDSVADRSTAVQAAPSTVSSKTNSNADNLKRVGELLTRAQKEGLDSRGEKPRAIIDVSKPRSSDELITQLYRGLRITHTSAIINYLRAFKNQSVNEVLNQITVVEDTLSKRKIDILIQAAQLILEVQQAPTSTKRVTQDPHVETFLNFLANPRYRDTFVLEGLKVFVDSDGDFAGALETATEAADAELRRIALSATELRSGANFRTMLRALYDIRARGWDKVVGGLEQHRRRFEEVFGRVTDEDLYEE